MYGGKVPVAIFLESCDSVCTVHSREVRRRLECNDKIGVIYLFLSAVLILKGWSSQQWKSFAGDLWVRWDRITLLGVGN